MNRVQKAAYELIQSDARFIYTLTHISKNANNIDSNYICMSLPYIGLFADGAEQWCRKIGLSAPAFNEIEKHYYAKIRLGHKLYEKSYTDYKILLIGRLKECDDYFYSIRGPLEQLVGYYNVGTDIYNNVFCGNTILCAMHIPIRTLGVDNIGLFFRNISIIAGKLAAYFKCTNFPPYAYDNMTTVTYKDYHFYKNCPIKLATDYGFVLFSILCSINYAIQFIDKYFTEEIPQKLKFAYLQYYYLCDFIDDLNALNDANFYINKSMQNRAFRNCLAHYGLGQFLSDGEIVDDDILKGLTNKAFNMDYTNAKLTLYKHLSDLVEQIENTIF